LIHQHSCRYYLRVKQLFARNSFILSSTSSFSSEILRQLLFFSTEETEIRKIHLFRQLYLLFFISTYEKKIIYHYLHF